MTYRWRIVAQKAVIIACVALVAIVGLAGPSHPAKANRAACAGLAAAFRAQGASRAVATRFGQIAWRESGCVLQCVSNRTDHSCSRFGINMKGWMPHYWGPLCGAWSREATKNVNTDVRCAYRAYRQLGWKPWR